MFGWKMCSRFNFIAIFLIFVNVAAFLDDTKENADLSTNECNLRLIFIFSKSTCLRLLAHKIWSLYLLPDKSYVGGLFCPPPTKIGLSNSPTTIGLMVKVKVQLRFSAPSAGIAEIKQT